MKNNPALKTLFIYNSIFVFAGNLLGPLFAVYVQGFHQNPLTISSVWAVFIFFTTLFTFIVYKIGDRIIEKEYLLLAGFFIRFLAWFCYIFAGNLLAIIIIQILLALGEACGSPAFDSLVSQHIDQKFRVSEYSQYKILSNLSIALATVFGGLIVSLFGFKILFLLMSLLALFCFFAILTKPRKLL